MIMTGRAAKSLVVPTSVQKISIIKKLLNRKIISAIYQIQAININLLTSKFII